MLEYKEIIKEFESAYKHLGTDLAERMNKEDISFWERAGMVDFVQANILRFINEAIAKNHGKFL